MKAIDEGTRYKLRLRRLQWFVLQGRLDMKLKLHPVLLAALDKALEASVRKLEAIFLLVSALVLGAPQAKADAIYS
jgi:hypothetical protein